MNIYLDIETVPGQAPGLRDELAATIKPPATLKKAESIQAWIDNDKAAAVEEAWLKTSLDGTYGQIVVIGMAIDDDASREFVVRDLSATEEACVLGEFWAAVRNAHSGNASMKPTIIGHNVISFDLPFLWKRSVILQVRPPFWWPRNPKPWADGIVDTMTYWAGDRGTISLDRLCRALGIEGKGDGMTGADVWPAVRDGRIAEVSAYCAADVIRTRAVHRRMTFYDGVNL